MYLDFVLKKGQILSNCRFSSTGHFSIGKFSHILLSLMFLPKLKEICIFLLFLCALSTPPPPLLKFAFSPCLPKEHRKLFDAFFFVYTWQMSKFFPNNISLSEYTVNSLSKSCVLFISFTLLTVILVLFCCYCCCCCCCCWYFQRQCKCVHKSK